jgi:hypothetical protein
MKKVIFINPSCNIVRFLLPRHLRCWDKHGRPLHRGAGRPRAGGRGGPGPRPKGRGGPGFRASHPCLGQLYQRLLAAIADR